MRGIKDHLLTAAIVLPVLLTLTSSGVIAASPDDGSANAPACGTQYPSLLSSYADRPSWSVAGVDYCVGYPAGTKLKDPTTISLPGVSVDIAHRIIHINANNVTLSGYDFSLFGGYAISIEGAANTTIKNSNFLVGAPQYAPPLTADAASANTIIEYCVIDGGGLSGAGYNPARIPVLISMDGSTGGGGITLKYNWLKNAPQDIVDVSQGPLIYQYNFVEDLGWYLRASPAGLRFLAGNHTGSIISYNTFRAPNYPPFPIGLGVPIFVHSQGTGSSITNTEVAYNTIICSAAFSPSSTGCTYAIAFQQDQGTANTGGTVHDNFMDISSGQPFYPSSGGAAVTYSNNYNMRTGALFPTNP